MPIVTVPQVSRRGFLAAGASALSLTAQGAESRWALFADTHIPADPQDGHRGFIPADNLTKVVAQAQKFQPAGVVICGDVARLVGKVEDYAALQPLIAPLAEKTPFVMALGNHDDRANFRTALAPQTAVPLKDKHVTVVDAGPVTLVVLDSLIKADYTPGLLGKAQRQWLMSWLQTNTGKPVLIFVHHTLDDGDGSLLDSPRLFDIVKGIPSVKAILFGHSHVYSFDTWEGIHLINLPAIGYNFRDSEPVGWVEAALSSQGASFTLRAVGGNTQKDGRTTSVRWRA